MQGRLRPPLFRKPMTPKHSLFSSLGRRLGGLFKKETTPEAGPRALSDRGLLAFSHTGDVIRAERLLRQQGFDVEVKGPPSRLEHWLMVRAANMKITVDCRDRRIVNISGGGCPDVPWLAHCLCGKTLDTAPEPLSLGQTLCCYSLQKAFEEIRRQLACGS